MRKEILKDKLFKFAVIFFSFISMIPLFLILFQITKNGIKAINLEFFTSLPKPPGEKGGGILNALIGTFELIIIGAIFSTPPGIIIGIFLAEFENRFTQILKNLVNVLQSIPSIVIGILAYLWIVVPLKRFSALSGGIALSIMMLPIVIKNTEETFKILPFSLKEASYSLGANYTNTVLKILLPSSASGILTGVLVGISRIAGETAPLLFTAFGNPFLNLNPLNSVESLSLLIFKYAISPYDEWHRLAWGASFILILIVLFLNILTKIFVEKWRVRF